MKFSLLATAIALLSTTATACYQVHTYFQGDPFGGDTLSVQAKDNDVEVCNGGATSYLSSTETVWTITCGTRTLTFTDNGRTGSVTDPAANYGADLVMSSTDSDEFDCYCTDKGCLNCPETESCLDDNYWNCDAYPYCALCDYMAYC